MPQHIHILCEKKPSSIICVHWTRLNPAPPYVCTIRKNRPPAMCTLHIRAHYVLWHVCMLGKTDSHPKCVNTVLGLSTCPSVMQLVPMIWVHTAILWHFTFYFIPNYISWPSSNSILILFVCLLGGGGLLVASEQPPLSFPWRLHHYTCPITIPNKRFTNFQPVHIRPKNKWSF